MTTRTSTTCTPLSTTMADLARGTTSPTLSTLLRRSVVRAVEVCPRSVAFLVYSNCHADTPIHVADFPRSEQLILVRLLLFLLLSLLLLLCTRWMRGHCPGQWFCFNDDVVRPIHPGHVVSADGYILFYRRRNLSPRNLINALV